MRKINTRDFKRATRSTSREINRQIVLNLVREHQPISRADVARRMKVGRGMVTSLVNDLMDEGAVFERSIGEAPRGRKPTLLCVRTHDRLVIAIDVRFSRTQIMLSDFAGTQLALETFDTLFSPAELTGEIAKRIRRFLRTYEATGLVKGIGLVVPGMVDSSTGRVLNSPQLGWRNVDIRNTLQAATGLPVYIENAPFACALAQMWLGQRGDGGGDFVYVTVSDGVGAGVVVNGQIVRGHGHTAGEFGHVPLNPDGPLCLCGSRGCWEAYTSNLATVARYLGYGDMGPEAMRDFLLRQELTVAELITRARTGDAQARSAIEETGQYLGHGFSMIVNTLNPSKLVVGGEITAAWDMIEDQIRAIVAARALTTSAARTPILPEQASSHPRLMGATALVTALSFAAPKVA